MEQKPDRPTIDLPCRKCGETATVWLDDATYHISAYETRVARTCICPAGRVEYGRRMDGVRARKIWLKSTGPRTPEGKAKSSINARKEGYEKRQKDKRLRNYLRLNRLLLNLYTSHCEQWPLLKPQEKVAALHKMYFFQNELSVLTKEIIDGLSERSNIIPFPKTPPT